MIQRRVKNRKYIFHTLAIILCVAAGVYFLFGLPVSKTLTLYGNVDIREVALSMRVNGRLSAAKVEEGDKVSQGQELAWLDNVPFKDRLAAAQAQADSLSASLVNAEQVLARVQKLRAEKTKSQAELDQAVAARDIAKANLAAAKADRASAETALNDTRLLAPADGVIRSRVREPGSILAVGEPVYVLSLSKPLRVRGYIGEPDLGKIYPGQSVAVHSDSNPKKVYKGTIGFIASTAEFTPKTVETPQLRSDLVYRFWVTLDPAETGLRQGMPVTITLLWD